MHSSHFSGVLRVENIRSEFSVLSSLFYSCIRIKPEIESLSSGLQSQSLSQKIVPFSLCVVFPKCTWKQFNFAQGTTWISAEQYNKCRQTGLRRCSAYRRTFLRLSSITFFILEKKPLINPPFKSGLVFGGRFSVIYILCGEMTFTGSPRLASKETPLFSL